MIAISLPADMAKQVEQIAKKEQRSISELFREAFRSYRAQRAQRAFEAFAELDQIGSRRKRNRSTYTEADVHRLVHEARKELEPSRKPKREAAALKK